MTAVATDLRASATRPPVGLRRGRRTAAPPDIAVAGLGDGYPERVEPLVPIIGVVLGVLVVDTVATRYRLPPPILLVLAGFAFSFIPGIPAFEVSPELVLSVLLPPLLFGAAFESSAVALRWCWFC